MPGHDLSLVYFPSLSGTTRHLIDSILLDDSVCDRRTVRNYRVQVGVHSLCSKDCVQGPGHYFQKQIRKSGSTSTPLFISQSNSNATEPHWISCPFAGKIICSSSSSALSCAGRDCKVSAKPRDRCTLAYGHLHLIHATDRAWTSPSLSLNAHTSTPAPSMIKLRSSSMLAWYL